MISKKQKQRGFTFVEVLVALVIIAVGRRHPLRDHCGADQAEQQGEKVADADEQQVFGRYVQRFRGAQPPAEICRADVGEQRRKYRQPDDVFEEYDVRVGARFRQLFEHLVRVEQQAEQQV